MNSAGFTLILGGARSGKSDYAEKLAATLAETQATPQGTGGQVLYVATAQAWDDEMRTRIEHHRAARPAHWRTLEAAHEVGRTLQTTLEAEPAQVVLLDCMTLLASNVLIELPEDVSEADAMAAMQSELEPLLAAYHQSREGEQKARWIVVSNEVGLGIVPAYPLGRVYRDVLGRVNRQLAAVADSVLLMVAGLPFPLKPPIAPLDAGTHR